MEENDVSEALLGFCAVTVYLLQIGADFSHIELGLCHSCSQVEAQIFEHDPIRPAFIADGAFPSLSGFFWFAWAYLEERNDKLYYIST